MKIIIPMAGWGSRLRPHTLTIPKPMVTIAGKPIVQRLVEGLMGVVTDNVEEVHFVIRKEFGEAIERKLMEVADSLNVKGLISYQESPEGTAHAIYCAESSLDGNVIVAFADTLFDTNFKLDSNSDGVIWVKKVDNPSAFGVVKLDSDNVITDFIEKPVEKVSDLAIIGIYYFKDGQALKREIQHIIENDIREKGEYQLTNALENLKSKGAKFVPGEVKEWLDFGNKNACVYSNSRVLEWIDGKEETKLSSNFKDSLVIQPCYIGKNVQLTNSIIGPHVSIGDGTVIENGIVKNSIIQQDCELLNVNLESAMIGNKVIVNAPTDNSSLGDYTTK